MRICYVYDGDYPWDIRVEKICLALTAAGHEVHLTVRNKLRRPARETLPEATVHRLTPLPLVPAKVDNASTFPAFMNPRWYAHIRNVAREIRAELILCRDLPLMPTCVMIGRSLGIPSVLDMAENYPAMLASRHSTGRSGPVDFLIRSPRFASWVENWTMKRLDGVLVVVQESADRLVRMGVPAERVAVVSNTPPLSRLEGPVADHQSSPTMKIVYLGIVEAQRGIGTLLDAMSIIRREGRFAQLVVYGDGIDAAHFRDHAARLGLTGQDVQFRGRVPNPVALGELPSAHVGVVPHWKDESWDTTIPNKLFDYMACGLAVVSSDVIPCKRILAESGAGLVFRDRNETDLAAVLGRLADARVRAEAGAKGREAVARTYNWESDVERMLSLLQKIVSR